MQKPYYRPELDVLRFFAFLCVFVDHTSLYPRRLGAVVRMGAFGLCIFFLLSAYLIVTLLLKERTTTGTVAIWSFYARRILRIWPLYFLAIALGAIYCHVFHVQLLWQAIAGLLTLSANVYVFHHGWTMGPLNPLWSISVEEQFYLVVPGLARLGGRRLLQAFCIVTLLLAYVVLTVKDVHGTGNFDTLWPNTFVQFQFFAAGGLIALWTEGRRYKLHAAARLALIVAGLGAWYASTEWCHQHSTAAPERGLVVAGYALALLGTVAIFLGSLNAPVRFPAALTYLGKISFGLYVFHSFFLFGFPGWPREFLSAHRMLAPVINLLLTVAAAAVSYHLYERPILRLKRRFEVIPTRPA